MPTRSRPGVKSFVEAIVWVITTGIVTIWPGIRVTCVWPGTTVTPEGKVPVPIVNAIDAWLWLVSCRLNVCPCPGERSASFGERVAANCWSASWVSVGARPLKNAAVCENKPLTFPELAAAWSVWNGATKLVSAGSAWIKVPRLPSRNCTWFRNVASAGVAWSAASASASSERLPPI